MIMQCVQCKEEIEVDDDWAGLQGECPNCKKTIKIPGQRKPIKPSQPVLLCAVGLIAAFFMPWFQLMGFGVSGYQLAQLGSYGNYAWVIPILAGCTVGASLSDNNNRSFGMITGIVPLLGLAYGFFRLQTEAGDRATQGVLEASKHVVGIGVYLTLILSAAIIFFSTPSSRSPE